MADQIHMFMLDALLDTRMATLDKINPELASRIMQDPELHLKYLHRPNDLFLEFGLVPEEFEEAYAKRNVETLMNSLPTNFLFELVNIGSSLVTLKSQEPHNVENIKFVINTWPYHELTTAERDRILDAIGARLQAIIELESIYRAPAQLSPVTVKGLHYSALYFYDFRDWLKEHYHKDRVTEQTVGIMPGVYIYTSPQFVDIDKLKEAAEYQNPNGENTSPLVGLQVMFSPYFRLELMDLGLLSIVKTDTVIGDIGK